MSKFMIGILHQTLKSSRLRIEANFAGKNSGWGKFLEHITWEYLYVNGSIILKKERGYVGFIYVVWYDKSD
jgi:hypothetical protein